MDKTIKRYYKRQQHGGRSALARIADLTALHIVLMLAFYLWYRYSVKNLPAVILLTLVTSLLSFFALNLWRALSFDKFIKKEQARLSDIVLRERLLLLPEKGFRSICEKAAREMNAQARGRLFIMRQSAPLNEDDILHLYHTAQKTQETALTLCSLSPLCDGALALFSRLPITANLIKEDAILLAAKQTEGYAVNTIDVDAYIYSIASIESERRKSTQAQPFIRANIKKYLHCAALLIAVSFFAGYAFYYRLLAGVCVSLAFTAFFLNRPARTVNQQ